MSLDPTRHYVAALHEKKWDGQNPDRLHGDEMKAHLYERAFWIKEYYEDLIAQGFPPEAALYVCARTFDQ